MLPRVIAIAVVALATAAEGAPEPDLRSGRTPRPRDSVLEVSAEIPLSTVEALVRRRMPAKKRWKAAPYTHAINGGAGTVDGISVGYDIVAGTASVSGDRRGRIVTTIPVGYSVWARYQPVAGAPAVDASCVKRAASIVLTTALSVRRSRITPSTRASVAARSRCVVSALRIDVTDLLGGFIGAHLERVAGEIDREIADSLKIDGAAAIVWNSLQAPRKSAGGWLDLDLRGVQARPVEVRGAALRATLQIIARGALRADRPEPRRTAMPAVNSHASPPKVSLVVEATVDHAALDRRATAAIRRVRGGRGIDKIVLRPRGRLIAVGADIAGRGQVWATGEIDRVSDHGVIAVRGLRWTAESARELRDPRGRLAAITAAIAAAEVPELAGLRARAQDALTESLTAVPLVSGAAAIDTLSFASAVRDRTTARLFFRAEGRSVDGGGCKIRRGAAITTARSACTRAAVAATCKRPCEYSTDGATWLRAK